MDKYITAPITEEISSTLCAGDYVYISGIIYVARDAAHKRMMETLEKGETLPLEIKDSTIIKSDTFYFLKRECKNPSLSLAETLV